MCQDLSKMAWDSRVWNDILPRSARLSKKTRRKQKLIENRPTAETRALLAQKEPSNRLKSCPRCFHWKKVVLFKQIVAPTRLFVKVKNSKLPQFLEIDQDTELVRVGEDFCLTASDQIPTKLKEPQKDPRQLSGLISPPLAPLGNYQASTRTTSSSALGLPYASYSHPPLFSLVAT